MSARFLSDADRVRFVQVGRHGLHGLIGVALTLFAAFLSLFNVTAFF